MVKIDIAEFGMPSRMLGESQLSRAELFTGGRLYYPDREFWDVPYLDVDPNFSIRFAEKDRERPITEVMLREGIVIVEFKDPMVELSKMGLVIRRGRDAGPVGSVIIKPGSVKFKNSAD